jgi:hypothetical protein
MYRIELAPGEETVFRTIEELAIAVRNGLVTARCRIYHNASQKWLPIEFHPHYKKALEIPAARLAEFAASRPAEKPRFDTLSFVVASAAKPAPEKAAEPAVEQVGEPEVKSVAKTSPEPAPVTKSVAARSVAPKPIVDLDAAEAPTPKRTQLERVQTPRPLAVQSSAEHRVAARKTGPAAAERSAEHRLAGHADGEHPVAEHPAEHLIAARHVAQHPVIPEPVAPPPAQERVAPDPWPAERSVAETTDTHHAAVDRSPLASHMPTGSEPSAHPEPSPRPAPSLLPWDRPNSYLPTTARIVADDPFVAIAPAPAVVPPVEAHSVDAAAATPSWMGGAPALELPNISYPEITPAEEPISERAGGSRGRRMLQVAVAVLVLAAGGYLARSFYSPVRGGDAQPEPAVADRPALPSDASPPTATPTGSTSPGATKPLAATPAPARPGAVTPHAAASPGPDLSTPASSGFAAALEPRANVSGPLPRLPYAGAGAAPARSVGDSLGAPAPIAPPPPQAIDVPSLPGSVPLVPTASEKNDSAMKRILRAVTGGKDSRQR